MKKKQTLRSNGTLTLTEAKAQSQQVTPELLEQFLHQAQMNCHAFAFRIQAAQSANDTERVKQLNDNAEYARVKKRAAYFEKQIAAQFPDYKPSAPNLKQVEQQIVVNDYLSALALKRDAQIQSQAAKDLEEEVERQKAMQDYQRALRYLKFLEPKFKRFEKQAEAQSGNE